MAKSIIQKEKECYLCRIEANVLGYRGDLSDFGLDRHHFIHGTAHKKKAERYGLWAYVCRERHHVYGKDAPHANMEVDKILKGIAQKEFEKKYSHEKWMEVFGKNYI